MLIMKMMIPGIAQNGGELAEELRIEDIPFPKNTNPVVKVGVGEGTVVVDARQLRAAARLFEDSLAERI